MNDCPISSGPCLPYPGESLTGYVRRDVTIMGYESLRQLLSLMESVEFPPHLNHLGMGAAMAALADFLRRDEAALVPLRFMLGRTDSCYATMMPRPLRSATPRRCCDSSPRFGLGSVRGAWKNRRIATNSCGRSDRWGFASNMRKSCSIAAQVVDDRSHQPVSIWFIVVAESLLRILHLCPSGDVPWKCPGSSLPGGAGNGCHPSICRPRQVFGGWIGSVRPSAVYRVGYMKPGGIGRWLPG